MGPLHLEGQADGVAAGTRRAQAQAVDGVLQLRLQRGQLGVGVHVVPPAGGDGLAAELGGNVHLAADADADAVGGAGLAAGVDGGLQDEALQAGEVFAQLGGGHNLHGVAQLGAAALKADDEVDVFLAGVVFILDIGHALAGVVSRVLPGQGVHHGGAQVALLRGLGHGLRDGLPGALRQVAVSKGEPGCGVAGRLAHRLVPLLGDGQVVHHGAEHALGGFIRFPGQCVFKQPLHIGGDLGHGADNRVVNGGFDKCFVLIHSAMLHS